MRTTLQHDRRAWSLSALNVRAIFSTCYLACMSLHVLALSGCTSPAGDGPTSNGEVAHTPSTQRSARRAFDGAPPVIPHQRLGATCTECHNETGKKVPQRGYAPANPHLHTAGLSATANCTQCHVFNKTTEVFTESNFVGLLQTFHGGDRLYAAAPPAIPHRVFMRENCNACHDGPSARTEIRCSHPQRTNCRQCHVPQQIGEGETEFPPGAPLSSK